MLGLVLDFWLFWVALQSTSSAQHAYKEARFLQLLMI